MTQCKGLTLLLSPSPSYMPNIVTSMRPHARKLMLLFLILLSGFDATASDSGEYVSQYAHMSWQVRDGFFTGTPRVMTQTTDGYLWIGTEAGLLRFDGTKFTVWDPPDGLPLPSVVIESLLGASDGSLWIGTGAGLLHWVQGKVVRFPDFTEYVSFNRFEDRLGHVWIARTGTLEQKGPLCEVSGIAAIRCLDRADVISLQTCCGGKMTLDGRGNIWVGTDRYLLRWKEGSAQTYLPLGLGGKAREF